MKPENSITILQKKINIYAESASPYWHQTAKAGQMRPRSHRPVIRVGKRRVITYALKKGALKKIL
jgi:hypothetical protein